MPDTRRTARRVQRTRRLLHGVLALLIHEKPYDTIGVKEILGRADVGRSTFFTHFRDKDELLESGVRDALRACEAAGAAGSTGRVGRLLRFSLPLFAHIEQFREADSAWHKGNHARVHDRLRQAIAESVAHELLPAAGVPPGRGTLARPTLLADFVASTFVLVVDWWMTTTEPIVAADADAEFRRLFAPSLVAALGT